MGRICRKNILSQKPIRNMRILSGIDLLEFVKLNVVILELIFWKQNMKMCIIYFVLRIKTNGRQQWM